MTPITADVRQGFAEAGIPAELADMALDAFVEAKRRFYLDDLRPSAIEGGRFSEAVFRILQWCTRQSYTPVGKMLPMVPALLDSLEKASGPMALR